MAADKKRTEAEEKIVYNLEFHPLFQNDIQSGYDYYEEKQPDLGEQFLVSVEQALATIQENPLLFQKIHGNKRKINSTRFPYGIIFYVKGKTVFVTNAFHLHRHPSIWKQRKH